MLLLANLSVSDQATYTLRITNAAGSMTTAPASLTVYGVPEIIAQPSSTMVGSAKGRLRIELSGVQPYQDEA